MKRLLGLGFAVLTAIALSGCGPQNPFASEPGTIVVGSADFGESELLMDIYAEALRKTGAEVETRSRIGSREIYVNAVRSGEITVMPDYTGNLLQHVNPDTEATEKQAVYDELKAHLGPGLDVQEQSPAEDSDVLTVTAPTARSGLRSMADLGPRCGDLVLGAPAEWKQRWESKIAEVYGCEFKEIRSVEAGTITVEALTGGQVQVANLFTTSSAIPKNQLVGLDDPKNMFPAQNVVPLVGAGKLNPAQSEALNRASRALTTDKLTELDRQVEIDKANPADVAKSFIAGVGM